MSFMGSVGMASGPMSGLRSARTPGRIQGSPMMGMGYPSPFFDVAQTYMPTTMKHLFKWCRYYFLTNPLINATVFKLSEYPVTDIIVDHESPEVKKLWTEYLQDQLRYRAFQVEVGLDYHTYGNGMVGMGFPFKKYLYCVKCDFRDQASKIRPHWVFTNHLFRLTCPRCGWVGDAKARDFYFKNASAIKTIRWNPEDVEITYNDLSGDYTYYYTIPSAIRNDVIVGRKEIVEGIPQVFIQALREQKGVIFSKENFFHLRRPTLATQDRGWGIPLLLPVLKDTFYLQVMKKAQEAILLEHIVPLRVLFPQAGSGSSDPYTTISLVDWRDHVAQEIARWRYDNNYIPILPLPIGQETIGGDGKALLLTSEIQQWSEQLMVGMGVPREFLIGGMCLADDTLVFTSHGLEELSEITPNEPGTAIIERTVQSHEGRRLASQGHHVGKKKAVRLRTRLGLELTGAPTHPLLVLRKDLSQEFVRIEDLQPGDVLGVKGGADLWAPKPYVFDVELEKVGGRYANRNLPTISLPKKMTPELARIMGYLISEGSCSDERRISFSNKDVELLDDFEVCMEAVFGYVPTRTERVQEDGSSIYVSEISRQTAVEFLRKVGVEGYSGDKRVPEGVRKSPKTIVVEFLRAYFDGDGGVEDVAVKQGVFAVSKSRRLLQEIQLLLLNAGIVSSLYPMYATRAVHALSVRSVFVDAFAKQIGFISSRKSAVLAQRSSSRLAGTLSDRVPHVKEALLGARDRHTHGLGAWKFEPIKVPLTKSTYSIDEIAELVDRDRTTIGIYVRSGALPATKIPGEMGRFGGYQVKKADLAHFLLHHGLGRRRTFGVGAWDMSYEKLAAMDLSSLRALEPELAVRVDKIVDQHFIWDEVKEIEDLDVELPMRDLGVADVHSYQANGILCHNSYAGTNVSMRMLENAFIGYLIRQLGLLRFVMKQVAAFMDWPEVKLRFKPFKMADDIQRKAYEFQLNQANKLSDTTLLASSDYSQEEENGIMMRETSARLESTKKQQIATAEIQGEAQLVMTKYQVKSQQEMQKAQMAPAAPGEPGAPEGAGGAPAAGQEQQAEMPPEDVAQMRPPQAGPAPSMFLQAIGSQLSGGQKMPTDQSGQATGLNVDLPTLAMQQARQISQMPPEQQQAAIQNLQTQSPELAQLVVQMLAKLQGSGGQGSGPQVDMRPLPEQRSPRRAAGMV